MRFRWERECHLQLYYFTQNFVKCSSSNCRKAWDLLYGQQIAQCWGCCLSWVLQMQGKPPVTMWVALVLFFFPQEWCTNPPGPDGMRRVHRSFYKVFSPCTHIECLWARAQSKSKFPCVFITVLKQVCIFFSTWRVGFMLNLFPP